MNLDGDLLTALAQIHVWSYGQDAFNIDIDFWEEIEPREIQKLE